MSIGNIYSELVSVDASAVSQKGYKQYLLKTSVTLATAAGGSIPSGASQVLIISEDFPFRWTDDGTVPVSGADGLGMPVFKLFYKGTTGNLGNLKLAPMGAATLNLSFYG